MSNTNKELNPSDYRNMYESLQLTKNHLENSLKSVSHSIERFKHRSENLETDTMSPEMKELDDQLKAMAIESFDLNFQIIALERKVEEGQRDYEDMRKFQLKFIQSDHENREFKEKLEKLDVDFFLKVVRDWKHSWMRQTQNDKADYQNYFNRAFGIDSNMVHSLARRLVEVLEKK